jgi:NAD(P)-dependent dehydrogenase (short-subunit alcohol dehydrogenase family)
MDLGIKDKVMIVTGGAKGIGEGISRCVAQEGGIPVIAGRSRDAGEALQHDLQEQRLESWFIEMELASVENCKKLVEMTLEKYGRIDAIFNNAGVNDGVGLEKGTPEKFAESVSTNLHHYYNIVHFALKALKKAKGSIVNISSKVAVTGQGNTSGYAAAKGAQLALTREWAVELLPYGIRVNCILPAEVMTPQYERWINTQDNPYESLDKITKKIPLENRMTTKEEIASMAVYLASDQASHITGQFLYVDGGYVHLDRMLS